MYMVCLPPDMIFQSTLSVRRATKLYAIVKYSKNISIHALRKESDLLVPGGIDWTSDISIHALRKESDHRVSSIL